MQTPRSLPLLCYGRPLGTWAVVAALCVAGTLAAVRLPIGLMPDVVYPMVRVQIAAGKAPPEVLLQTVTRVLEQELTQAEGVEMLESSTQQGQVQITMSFAPDRDVDSALRDTATWVDRAKGKLPADIEPPVLFKFDPQNLPVVEFGLTSSALDMVALRQFGEYELSTRFVGVPGVAAIRTAGGRVREVQVRADPARLRGHGLTLADLSTAIGMSGVQQPTGRIDAAGKELAGQVLAVFGDAQEIANLKLGLPNGDRIRVADVAAVVDSHREQRLIVRVNGEEGVKVSVFKSPQANSVEVSRAIRQRLEELRAARVIPNGVNVAVTADESIYIESSLGNARHALLLAFALIALVVLLFLRDWKCAVVCLMVLPIGLLATALLMRAFGLTLNLMSIGGLILGVTLMVDYGIVLMENITRHWSAGGAAEQPIARASQEVAGALVASLAALIAAVVPFLLFGGLALFFFREFIVTIVLATVAGLVAAFAVIPAAWPLVSRIVRHDAIAEGIVMRGLTSLYRALLKVCLAIPFWIVAGAIVAALFAARQLPRLGYVFLPEIDDGRVTITVQGDPGTLLAELDPQIRAIEALALEQPDVTSVDATVGGRIGQSIQEIPGTAELLVQLAPKSRRAMGVAEWTSALDRKMQSLHLAGAQVRARKARIRAIRTFRGQAATGDFDVVVNVEGQDPRTLAELGEHIRDQLRPIPGLTDLTTTLVLNQPVVEFAIDRPRAAVLGVTPTIIADALSTAVSGAESARLLDAGWYYDVRVMSDPGAVHGHLGDISTLPLQRTSTGDMLTLGQVVEVRRATGPLSIDRINQATINSVNGTVRGRTLGEVAGDVRRTLAAFPLPAGYSVSFGGRMAVLDAGGGGLWWVGGLSLFLVIVVLCVQYESLINPLLVVLVLPLGLCGSVAALVYTRMPLSTTVFIGMILLVGIAANNAVVLMAYIEQLRHSGQSLREAVLEGAVARLRPKLMTGLIAMAGLAPLAGGAQEGGEILQPLAITVIGGLPASLIATLVVLPVLYTAVHCLRRGSEEARRGIDGDTC